jgi:hypothetical protein
MKSKVDLKKYTIVPRSLTDESDIPRPATIDINKIVKPTKSPGEFRKKYDQICEEIRTLESEERGLAVSKPSAIDRLSAAQSHTNVEPVDVRIDSKRKLLDRLEKLIGEKKKMEKEADEKFHDDLDSTREKIMDDLLSELKNQAKAFPGSPTEIPCPKCSTLPDAITHRYSVQHLLHDTPYESSVSLGRPIARMKLDKKSGVLTCPCCGHSAYLI